MVLVVMVQKFRCSALAKKNDWTTKTRATRCWVKSSPAPSFVCVFPDKFEILMGMQAQISCFSALYYCNFWPFLALCNQTDFTLSSFYELYMHLSTSSFADYALVVKLVCSDGPTASLRGLGPMAPLEFLVFIFEGGFIIYIPQKYKVIPLKNNIYIYIYI